MLAPHALSEGRFVILFLLDSADDGLAPNELAAQSGVTRATITGLLDGLERESLIERHTQNDDRRTVRVRLTPKGKRLARKVFVEHGHWIAGLFQNLSARERQQLSGLLAKADKNLTSNTEETAP